MMGDKVGGCGSAPSFFDGVDSARIASHSQLLVPAECLLPTAPLRDE
jgi:hypothetical protein